MKKGFTLAEMIAVIAIISFLAVLSAPFIKGYVDDSYQAKAQAFMRELNEGRLNFQKDYPGVTVSGTFPSASSNPGCDIRSFYSATNTYVNPEVLVGCRYVRFPTELSERYEFKIGGTADCSICNFDSTTYRKISMVGKEKAGNYNGCCACIDQLNRIHKQDPSESGGCAASGS